MKDGDVALKEAAHMIKAGGLVIYPTETAYGLGADPYNRIAVLKVFGAKQRPLDKPLSVAVSSLEEADTLVFLNNAARKIAGRFLPGPVTIVLKKKARLPKELTGGSDKLGIRIPDNQMALDFIELAGPVTATSANISGRPAPTTTYEAKSQMGDKVDYVLDGGECKTKGQSTVIDLSNPESPIILREGEITEEEIKKALNKA
jgi:L-threonylcarbamoyladenylate synthase